MGTLIGYCSSREAIGEQSQRDRAQRQDCGSVGDYEVGGHLNRRKNHGRIIAEPADRNCGIEQPFKKLVTPESECLSAIYSGCRDPGALGANPA
jgi:hypothetical protein